MFPVVAPRHSFFRVCGGIVHIRRYLIQRNMYHSRIGKILETKLLLFCWYQNSVHWSCCHLDFVRPCFPKMVALPHFHFSCLSSFPFSLFFLYFSLFPSLQSCNNTAGTQKLLSNNMSLEKNGEKSRC